MTRPSHRFVTRCPACESTFHVQEAQLAAARGQVRCGQCLTAFDAREHARNAQIAFELPSHEEDPVPVSAPARAAEAEEGPRINARTRHRLRDLDQPLDLPVGPAKRDPWTGLRHGLPVAALFLLLLVQIFWHDRDTLAASPTTRPLVTGLCDMLGCQPAPYRNLDTLQSRNFSLRSIDGRDDALLLTLTIHNEDRFPQPLPGLDLAFTNPDDRIIAARRFLPHEYLNDDLVEAWQQDRGDASLPELPAGGSMDVQLTLADPGQEAVNYELAFSQP